MNIGRQLQVQRMNEKADRAARRAALEEQNRELLTLIAEASKAYNEALAEADEHRGRRDALIREALLTPIPRAEIAVAADLSEIRLFKIRHEGG